MKELEKKLRKNGFDYKQVKETERGFIYSQSMPIEEVELAEEKYYDGVKFHYDGEHNIWELKKQGEGYGIAGVYLLSVITVERIVSNFADGTWVEVKENQKANIPTQSIEQLLLDAITLNNSIKRGFDLFAGIDDSHRLELIKEAQKSLKSKVAELNNILNPQPLQSVV